MSKVPCLQCGAQILPNTAERNTGLCMPCKNSLEYKVRVEPEKQKAREQRALELIDPWRKLWQDLTDRVQNTVQGFGGLSDPEKKYFAVGLLDREVLSSGFTHFLSKNPDTYYKYAMLGLKEMGAINAENCLQRAKVGVLKFGDILERNNGPMARLQYMKFLDEYYREHLFNVVTLNAAFARKHKLV